MLRQAHSLFFALALMLFSTTPSHAAGDYKETNVEWGWLAGGAVFVAGLSQVKDSHVAFAALEAGAAFYMMNEWYKDNDAPLAKLITPLALTTLALVNLTLLNDDDTTSGDVFRYNAGGLSLITLNYFWTY
jgi:hypothetical protein